MTQESPRGGLKTVTTGVMTFHPDDLCRLHEALSLGFNVDGNFVRYTIIEEKVEFTQ